MTEKLVLGTIGVPEGGSQDHTDRDGPYRRLRYGQHRGGGHYELEVTIRNGVVAKVDYKPRTGTPAPSLATPVAMQAVPPPVMAAAAPVSTSSGAGKTLGLLLVVVLGVGAGAYFLLGGDSSPPASSPDVKAPRPKIHVPSH